jgi:uncharacterized protein YebE (UPF0316 family)
MTTDAILLALGIFILRVINNTIGTIRVVLVTRQQRLLASGLGFFESLIFAVTMAVIVVDLTNVLNLFAYCSGFSVGSYLGMALEARFITSYMTVNVITHDHGHEIAEALRAAGYGVTQTAGEGRDGEVCILRSTVINRDVPKILDIVRDSNPAAFIAVDQARTVKSGVIRASKPLSH